MPETEIKPATKEEAVRISNEMKKVADNVSREVDKAMKFCESAAKTYAKTRKK